MQSIKEKYVLGLSEEGFHRISYREWGRRGKKPTIICVHGVTRLAHDFDVLAEALSKDYHVVCPDIAGRGNSDWFHNHKHYNFTQYCADINALIARLDVEKVHYIGTSMGGIIGMILAGLPNGPIASLVINDIGPEQKMSEIRRLGNYMGLAPEFGDMDEVTEYVRTTYSAFGNLSDQQWKQMGLNSVRKHSDGYKMHYDPKIGKAFRSNYYFYTFTLWHYWDKIACPTLALRGELSTFLSAETAEKMTQRGPKCKVVEIKEAGHAPALQSPYEIKVIKDFISSV